MISEMYDKFFGDGYWEKQYKPHIVVFAEKCVKAALLKAESAEKSDNTTKATICPECKKCGVLRKCIEVDKQ